MMLTEEQARSSMNIFPPDGYACPQDGTDAKWTRWFAWFPVTIDAYDESEIRNGKMRYRVWMCWVECRLSPDGPPPHEDVSIMQFRLPQKTATP